MSIIGGMELSERVRGTISIHEFYELQDLESELSKLQYVTLPNGEVTNCFEAYIVWKRKADALREYATHKPGCHESGNECICGLDALLKRKDNGNDKST